MVGAHRELVGLGEQTPAPLREREQRLAVFGTQSRTLADKTPQLDQHRNATGHGMVVPQETAVVAAGPLVLRHRQAALQCEQKPAFFAGQRMRAQQKVFCRQTGHEQLERRRPAEVIAREAAQFNTTMGQTLDLQVPGCHVGGHDQHRQGQPIQLGQIDAAKLHQHVIRRCGRRLFDLARHDIAPVDAVVHELGQPQPHQQQGRRQHAQQGPADTPPAICAVGSRRPIHGGQNFASHQHQAE